MIFYAVFDTIRVFYDFMTKLHIEFTIDHEFDDNSSTVRVNNLDLMGFRLMRLVSNVLIFLQGWFCIKAANDTLGNLITFDIQQNAVGAFRKLSDNNILLKKHLNLFTSL